MEIASRNIGIPLCFRAGGTATVQNFTLIRRTGPPEPPHGVSERQLQRELETPHIIGLRVVDKTKPGAGEGGVGLAEPWRIEGVKGLQPELEPQPLLRVKGLEERGVHERG